MKTLVEQYLEDPEHARMFEACRLEYLEEERNETMSGKMTATQAKSMCEGAGAPPEVMEAAEMKGVDLGSLWQAYQQITRILADTTKTGPQKAWAILLVVVTTLLAPGPAPTPNPMP